MSSRSERSTGQVKWFSNKSGYGFITSLDEGYGDDIFVHHSAIRTAADQYRYLVQGEYVMFTMTEGSDGKRLAGEVRGIREGPLMCEVRVANSRGNDVAF